MKNILNNFYTQNKVLFEIIAVLLVVAGLILNIADTSGVIGDSIAQLKFIILFTLIASATYLIDKMRTSILVPLLEEEPKEYNKNSVLDLQDVIIFYAKKIIFVTFIAFLGSLFIINLITYLVFDYPNETTFMAVTLLGYLILINASSKIYIVHKSWIYIYQGLIALCILIIPISAYFYFVFQNFQQGMKIIMLASIISGVFLIVLGNKKS